MNPSWCTGISSPCLRSYPIDGPFNRTGSHPTLRVCLGNSFTGKMSQLSKLAALSAAFPERWLLLLEMLSRPASSSCETCQDPRLSNSHAVPALSGNAPCNNILHCRLRWFKEKRRKGDKSLRQLLTKNLSRQKSGVRWPSFLFYILLGCLQGVWESRQAHIWPTEAKGCQVIITAFCYYLIGSILDSLIDTGPQWLCVQYFSDPMTQHFIDEATLSKIGFHNHNKQQ